MNKILNIKYAQPGDRPLLLDLYLPQHGTHPPELLVWIHGGAWRQGDKDDPRLLSLVEDGFALASIQYRLSHEAIFPAQIHDCKGAIRWLRAHADNYGYNAQSIGVAGASAGGHLVALLGTSGGTLEGESGGHLEQSSHVQAVVDFYGPTNFLAMLGKPSDMDHAAADSPESLLVGEPIEASVAQVQAADPIHYITADAPPFLIIHGNADPLVPYDQSIALHEALVTHGVESTLDIIDGGGHGGPEFFEDHGRLKAVRNFFRQHIL